MKVESKKRSKAPPKIKDRVEAGRAADALAEVKKRVVAAQVVGQGDFITGDGGKGEGRRRLHEILLWSAVAPAPRYQPGNGSDGQGQRGDRRQTPLYPSPLPPGLSTLLRLLGHVFPLLAHLKDQGDRQLRLRRIVGLQLRHHLVRHAFHALRRLEIEQQPPLSARPP